MQQNNPAGTKMAVNPLAPLVWCHTWLDGLTDPDAPLWADRHDTALAGAVARLDARCPGEPPCDSRAMVSVEQAIVVVATGHAAGCGWFGGWLARRDPGTAVPVTWAGAA